MARFLARVLRHLGGSYSIEGSEVSTNQVDLASVQLVHDVSKMLISGRTPGFYSGWGVAVINFTFTATSGASTPSEIKSLDPYTSTLPHSKGGWNAGDIPLEFDLYLYGVSLGYERVLTGSTISNAQSSMEWPNAYRFDNTAGNVRGRFMSLQTWSSSAFPLDATGGDRFAQRPSSDSNTAVVPYPILIPRPGEPGTSKVLQGRVAADLPGTGNGDQTAMRASMAFVCRFVPRGLPVTP